MPISTEPTSTPSPNRPTPTEVVLELELERAVEHLERHRALDGVEGTEAVQGLVDPFGRLPLREVDPALAAGVAAEEPAEPAGGPRGVLAPAARVGGGGAEVVHHAEHELAQLPRPFGVGPQPFGEPLGLLVVELGLVRRGCRCGARAG